MDDAARYAFGKGAKIVEDGNVEDFGPIKNPEVRKKMEEMGYRPDDFRAKAYEVKTPTGT